MRCNVEFSFLDKNMASTVLPELFSLLYRNMKDIAFSGQPFSEAQREFQENVLPALEKPQRQLLLFLREGKTVGFCMYYVNQEKLTIEELQLEPYYHRHGIPYFLGRFLLARYDGMVSWVEAYAHKENLVSRELMKRLGFFEQQHTQTLFHYRCPAELLRKRFG